MIIERLKASIKKEEGVTLTRHEVKGQEHIGSGFLLEQEWPQDYLDYLEVDDEDEIEEITEEQNEWLLENNLNGFISEVANFYGDEVWNDERLGSLRQEILIGIAYQCGIGGFKKFRKMHAAIREHNYAEASAQILDSRVAKFQAPKRYQRYARAFATNDEVELELGKLYDKPKTEEKRELFNPDELDKLSVVEIAEYLANRLKEELTIKTEGEE